MTPPRHAGPDTPPSSSRSVVSSPGHTPLTAQLPVEPPSPPAAAAPTAARSADAGLPASAPPTAARSADEALGGLAAGRVTGDRMPSRTEIEEAATVVETALQAGRRKADRATRGVLSALLALEALVVLLVPRAIAQTTTGLDRTKTIVLVGLAVVLLATAFLMRRRWAVALGSVLQLALVGTGLLQWVMVIIAVIFIGLWIWVLTMRRDWVHTSGGLRMLVS